jgi:hypothetical protein
MGTVQLVLAPDSVRTDLTAETAARIAADAAITALGTGAVVDVSQCPVAPTGEATTTLAAWLSTLYRGTALYLAAVGTAARMPKDRDMDWLFCEEFGGATANPTADGTTIQAAVDAGYANSHPVVISLGYAVAATYTNVHAVPVLDFRSAALLRTSLGTLLQAAGTDNTAFGASALAALTSGAQNVAVGTSALAACATDTLNVAVGYQALKVSNGGINNVAVGGLALSDVTTGDTNVAVGASAGGGLTTGSGNTFLGYNAYATAGAGATSTIVLASGNQIRAVFDGSTWALTGDKLNLPTAKTPASAAAAGVAGDICWDASYIYVCVAANSWKRAGIAAW